LPTPGRPHLPDVRPTRDVFNVDPEVAGTLLWQWGRRSADPRKAGERARVALRAELKGGALGDRLE